MSKCRHQLPREEDLYCNTRNLVLAAAWIPSLEQQFKRSLLLVILVFPQFIRYSIMSKLDWGNAMVIFGKLMNHLLSSAFSIA